MTKLPIQPISDRLLVTQELGRWTVVEVADIFWLEAEGRFSWFRLRGRKRLKDRRPLGKLIDEVQPYGFLRIHRNHAVNLRRIAEIRRRRNGQDWEVKLEPPVNRVLPVSRDKVDALGAVFGRGS